METSPWNREIFPQQGENPRQGCRCIQQPPPYQRSVPFILGLRHLGVHHESTSWSKSYLADPISHEQNPPC